MSYGVGQHMTGENVRILNALQQHFTGSPFQKMCHNDSWSNWESLLEQSWCTN